MAMDKEQNQPVLGNDGEGEEYVESVENSIDRMRDEGGISPEIAHTDGRADEIQRQLKEGTLHN